MSDSAPESQSRLRWDPEAVRDLTFALLDVLDEFEAGPGVERAALFTVMYELFRLPDDDPEGAFLEFCKKRWART